jgi:hypothetical protein
MVTFARGGQVPLRAIEPMMMMMMMMMMIGLITVEDITFLKNAT